MPVRSNPAWRFPLGFPFRHGFLPVASSIDNAGPGATGNEHEPSSAKLSFANSRSW